MAVQLNTTWAKLYKQTGFNSINIPKDLSTLQTAARSINDYPAMELNQRYFLNSIRIKVESEFDVAGADYMCLYGNMGIDENSAFYAVHGYTMLAPDVAELSITMDSWMTAGGYEGLKDCLDGMVTRATAAQTNVLEDPLLVPHYPILAFVGSGDNIFKGSVMNNWYSTKDIIATTALLETLQTSFLVDAAHPTLPIFKPLITTNVPSGGVVTDIEMSAGDYSNMPDLQVLEIAGKSYYIGYEVNTAIDLLRSYGMEDAITDSYQVPADYIGIVQGSNYGDHIEKLSGAADSLNVADAIEYRIDYTGSLGYQEASPVTLSNPPKYIKTLLGKYNKYVLISPATGNSREVNPEDLAGSDFEGDYYLQKAPVIYYACDPRPEGCPYFNIKTHAETNMYVNAVQGEKWRQNPIVYRGESGAYVKMAKFENEQNYKNVTGSADYQDIMSDNNPLGLGIIARELKRGIIGAIDQLNIFGNVPSQRNTPMTMNAIMGDKSYQSEFARNIEAIHEREQFEFENQFVTPEIRFSPSVTLRDATGNGAMLVKFGLDPRDIALFDRIQEQFGQYTSEPLRKNMLSGDPFAYVEAKGVSVSLVNARVNCNKDIANDIANMFGTGIRIWSVKPDASYYNPYRS